MVRGSQASKSRHHIHPKPPIKITKLFDTSAHGHAVCASASKKGAAPACEYSTEYVNEADTRRSCRTRRQRGSMIARWAQSFFRTEIDMKTSLLESGFKFPANPNVTEASGVCDIH